MSDTPETDRFLKEFYPEHPEAAWVRTQLGVTYEGPLEQILKRLERERDDALSQIFQAECRAERFCQERDEARRELGEILAVIHRDGGHYTDKHGISKSVADAHATWADVVRERDEARELADQWRKESNWIGNEPTYKFPWEAAK